MQHPFGGVREKQHFARARHAHVEEPPLLLAIAGLLDGTLQRKQRILERGDENGVELQALGAMESHERHAFLISIGDVARRR